MEKILVSACLLGQKVRYDGGDCLQDHPVIKKWLQENRLVAICPEMAGGLSAPRPPCEIDRKTSQVVDQAGNDYSSAFQEGSDIALKMAKENNIGFALMKERSPSCGSKVIYDGTFSGKRIAGQGVTSQKLSENNIQLFNEDEIDQLALLIEMKEKTQ